MQPHYCPIKSLMGIGMEAPGIVLLNALTEGHIEPMLGVAFG
jgi:hypothetical protein